MVSTLPNPNPERRLVALARILKLLRDTEDFEYLVSSLLENLKEELGYTLLWFGIYQRTQQQVVSQGYVASKPHRLLKSNFSLEPGDLMEQVVVQQRPLIINDLQVESRIAAWNTLAEQLDIQGALMFPVRRREVCYGVLLMGSNQWGQTISNSDRTFISTICGALADVLHKREQALQTQKRKDPGTAVFSLIEQLRTVVDRDEQLSIVAQSIFQFVDADRVRIFWLNSTDFEFWERLTIQAPSSKNQKRYTSDAPGLTISASKIKGVYQVLHNQQLLVVGEAQSSHTASVPDQFMKLLKASALMVTPIFEHQMLLGFISVENKKPQVWNEANRDYLTTVASLTGLMMPSLSVEEVRQQSDAEVQLLTGLVHSIQNDSDWHQTLEKCGEDICQATDAQHFLVLLHDAERGGYNIVFRKTGPLRNRLSLTWPTLDEVDWQMLESSESAIAINDLTNDLKLLAWRENFQTLEAQSLLACNVAPGNAPEGIVVLASRAPRQWSPADSQLLQKIGHQIGLILRQWQLQRQTDQQEDLYGSIQWGLRTLQQTSQLEQLEESACQNLIDLLHASLVVLVTWHVGDPIARVSHLISHSMDFTVNQEVDIPIGSDAIINWAQQTDGPLSVTWEDFPPETRQWISAPPESKFLLMVLKTADRHVPNGVWIVAAGPDRKWTDHDFSLISLLSSQLAWSRRHLSVVNLLLSRQESLEMLNWYKHKRLAEVYRHLDANLQRLSDPMTGEKDLTHQQQLQLVRQLGTLTHGLKEILHKEAWELQSHQQTTPLISLLNRLMERVNPLIQARHLWAKVHNDSNVIIAGDLEKIEFVLFELVVAACERSPEQGRLDIWCRPLDRSFMELSITDDGDVPRQLLKDLKHGRPDDILVPSPLDGPPGLHFSICRTLIHQLGGQFSMQKLDDGRIMTRLLLAIAGKGKGKPPMGLPKKN
ncbi:GAF domain-containing protein [Oscillatoria sp. CS-180]|uniref:sensor histidine kinase n=1 Tax=Oscillatoria sp. CS-180 TaxID=3021720 RepID=UPI00232B7692|nr:GAF domain-containing protein [Oscillatoria sp. CS-180]MDB9525108.1 GAF domain-containing protein [Oscillatoria sp. CS-180]